MKRSEMNRAIRAAEVFFKKNGWSLPPNPRWDITDFSLGDFLNLGLVLVNLAEEAEYCEKLMYAIRNQVTPSHTHQKKKEDIICRTGTLIVRVWAENPARHPIAYQEKVTIKLNGVSSILPSGSIITLEAGERVTLPAGVWHEFHPASDECIIGEVSTANDDYNDNFFSDERIGRFSEIEEDEPAIYTKSIK